MRFARQVSVAEMFEVLSQRLRRRQIARLLQQRRGDLSGTVLTCAMGFAQRVT